MEKPNKKFTFTLSKFDPFPKKKPYTTNKGNEVASLRIAAKFKNNGENNIIFKTMLNDPVSKLIKEIASEVSIKDLFKFDFYASNEIGEVGAINLNRCMGIPVENIFHPIFGEVYIKVNEKKNDNKTKKNKYNHKNIDIYKQNDAEDKIFNFSDLNNFYDFLVKFRNKITNNFKCKFVDAPVQNKSSYKTNVSHNDDLLISQYSTNTNTNPGNKTNFSQNDDLSISQYSTNTNTNPGNKTNFSQNDDLSISQKQKINLQIKNLSLIFTSGRSLQKFLSFYIKNIQFLTTKLTIKLLFSEIGDKLYFYDILDIIKHTSESRNNCSVNLKIKSVNEIYFESSYRKGMSFEYKLNEDIKLISLSLSDSYFYSLSKNVNTLFNIFIKNFDMTSFEKLKLKNFKIDSSQILLEIFAFIIPLKFQSLKIIHLEDNLIEGIDEVNNNLNISNLLNNSSLNNTNIASAVESNVPWPYFSLNDDGLFLNAFHLKIKISMLEKLKIKNTKIIKLNKNDLESTGADSDISLSNVLINKFYFDSRSVISNSTSGSGYNSYLPFEIIKKHPTNTKVTLNSNFKDRYFDNENGYKIPAGTSELSLADLEIEDELDKNFSLKLFSGALEQTSLLSINKLKFDQCIIKSNFWLTYLGKNGIDITKLKELKLIRLKGTTDISSVFKSSGLEKLVIDDSFISFNMENPSEFKIKKLKIKLSSLKEKFDLQNYEKTSQMSNELHDTIKSLISILNNIIVLDRLTIESKTLQYLIHPPKENNNDEFKLIESIKQFDRNYTTGLLHGLNTKNLIFKSTEGVKTEQCFPYLNLFFYKSDIRPKIENIYFKKINSTFDPDINNVDLTELKSIHFDYYSFNRQLLGKPLLSNVTAYFHHLSMLPLVKENEIKKQIAEEMKDVDRLFTEFTQFLNFLSTSGKNSTSPKLYFHYNKNSSELNEIILLLYLILHRDMLAEKNLPIVDSTFIKKNFIMLNNETVIKVMDNLDLTVENEIKEVFKNVIYIEN
jgi:hypothetical protein